MNVVYLFSDEHSGSAMGNSGHPLVQTPNLDCLAEQSLVFDNAYCNYPICTPSRLSMLTGRYPHQIEAWDLGAVLDPDKYPTWGHHLSDYETILCGRTHFNGPDRLNGFGQRLLDDLPRWIQSGGAPRRGPDARRASNSHVSECGPGHHSNSSYDTLAADTAIEYLNARESGSSDKPFLLYCGFMLPHFPLIAHPDYYTLYDPETLELPDTWDEPLEDQHPIIQHHRWSWRNEVPPPEEIVRRATASYYALITYIDNEIGRILDAINSSSLKDDTVVIYTSDHGEMRGHHGIWQKQCFYEDAVRVPLMVRQPGGSSARLRQNVSLIDVLPTLLDIAGSEIPPDLPGRSLLETARVPDETPRKVFAEYHHMGMLNAGFMLKKGDHKLCHYVDNPPQLFDLSTDPDENHDLANDPGHAVTLADLNRELRALIDPDEINDRCRRNQAERAASTRRETE